MDDAARVRNHACRAAAWQRPRRRAGSGAAAIATARPRILDAPAELGVRRAVPVASCLADADCRGVIGAIAYLIHSPPRPLRRKLQQYMKDHPSLLRFRVGENVLVRWAHEDVILDDLEDETVVNGDDINYAEEEQIPLKPSPRKTGIVSYGTTKTK